MGYTTRTLERVMDVVTHLNTLGDSERAEDRWVAAQRLYLTSRTAGGMSHALWRKLLRIAVELNLIEVRAENPAHVDQRIRYLRVTESARKSILEGQAIGEAALSDQLAFHMHDIM